MSRPSPPTYKIRNWRSYNEALERRGPMAIWLDPKMTWEAKPTGRRLLVVAVFSPKVAIEISPVVSGRANQVKGLREIVFIHDLRRQGLSISAIARKVGSDRKTVRKYLEQGLEVPS